MEQSCELKILCNGLYYLKLLYELKMLGMWLCKLQCCSHTHTHTRKHNVDVFWLMLFCAMLHVWWCFYFEAAVWSRRHFPTGKIKAYNLIVLYIGMLFSFYFYFIGPDSWLCFVLCFCITCCVMIKKCPYVGLMK